MRPNARQCAAATYTQLRTNPAIKTLNRPSAPLALLAGTPEVKHPLNYNYWLTLTQNSDSGNQPPFKKRPATITKDPTIAWALCRLRGTTRFNQRKTLCPF
jgi:hypothetical protein